MKNRLAWKNKTPTAYAVFTVLKVLCINPSGRGQEIWSDIKSICHEELELYPKSDDNVNDAPAIVLLSKYLDVSKLRKNSCFSLQLFTFFFYLFRDELWRYERRFCRNVMLDHLRHTKVKRKELRLAKIFAIGKTRQFSDLYKLRFQW
jgi:hypothetical protein